MSGPAFPVQEWYTDGSPKPFGNKPGLTKREYFAGLAMQGMLAAAENYRTDELAQYAFQVADAMIEESNK